jgi:hypothetical protein
LCHHLGWGQPLHPIYPPDKLADTVSVLRGGDGNLQEREAYSADFPVGLALSDVDGDLDLITSTEVTDAVMVRLNRTVRGGCPGGNNPSTLPTWIP